MKDKQGTPLRSVEEFHMEYKVTPKAGGLSSEGLTLPSASGSASGREALIPAETEHGAEGPSAEEALSYADPLRLCWLPSQREAWPATEGVISPLCSQNGHDVVLRHVHMGLGSPLKYFATHIYWIHQGPTCLLGVKPAEWG